MTQFRQAPKVHAACTLSPPLLRCADHYLAGTRARDVQAPGGGSVVARKAEPRLRREHARRRDPNDVQAAESDEVLLSHVQRGSEADFNALYARYFARIYGFVRLRVGDRSDAEELTQEVFASVFRSSGGFNARSSVLSWIYGVARNTVLSHLRRKHTQRERLDRFTPELAASSPRTFTPEEQVRGDRFALELERRIGQLAPWQLDAFRLRHVENLPIEEISRRTSHSADAVRSGLYRAKRLLLDGLSPDGTSAREDDA